MNASGVVLLVSEVNKWTRRWMLYVQDKTFFVQDETETSHNWQKPRRLIYSTGLHKSDQTLFDLDNSWDLNPKNIDPILWRGIPLRSGGGGDNLS